MESIRGKPAAKPQPPLQAPEIEQRLNHAQARVSELYAQRRGTALDAETGDTAAAAQLENLNREIAAANDRVATLRAAHEAAIERDEATLQAQRAALQRTQLAAVRKHLEARNAAAVALTAALDAAAKQFHILLERSDKAQAACPIGMTWPHGALCEADPLRNLVVAELYRLSATPGNKDGHALPGAGFPSSEYEWQPATIPPMAERVGAASAYVLAKLTGKATE
jgi:small-conductance mechanosensitive channel